MNYNAIHVISFASGADSLGVSVGVLGPKDGHCFFVFLRKTGSSNAIKGNSQSPL